MILIPWVALNAMDIFLTWTAITVGGEELNPMFHVLGWELALLFKVVLIVGMPIAWHLVSHLHEASYRYGMRMVTGVTGAVVFWNVLVVV